MSTETTIPDDEPTIVMRRLYDAPRDLVWSVITEPEHVKRWWGGAGVTNPVCTMDVRPGGHWDQVMRFEGGHEMQLEFVFVAVERPTRLVWKNRDHGSRELGRPAIETTVTLEELGGRTRWTMVARFESIAERDAARELGYTGPIDASSTELDRYLSTLEAA